MTSEGSGPESHLPSDLLLTIQQAADLLGVSKNTIRRWCRNGLLECIRINSRGDRRFTRESLHAVLGPKRTGRPKSLEETESSHGAS
ncbi:helix-turn-helix domain-containing protein [bacterium]|nr:helix-turn-helix domain-containing protein [bacterium]